MAGGGHPRVCRALATVLLAAALAGELQVTATPHSDDEFVRNMYRAILCREGDEAGIAEKVKSLQDKTLTRSQMIMLARFSDEYQKTSTYIPEPLRGKTDGECGACSNCKTGSAENTVCCPGAVQVPPGYSDTAPDQSSYFKFAPYESCADCIVACPEGWVSMEPNTGPAKCNEHEKMACCSPELPWATSF
jgi:hypothetical protein